MDLDGVVVPPMTPEGSLVEVVVDWRQGILGMISTHDQAGGPGPGVDDPREKEDGSLGARRFGSLGEQPCGSWGVDPGASQQ